MGLKLEDLVAAAKQQGWRVKDTKSGVMFYPAEFTSTAVVYEALALALVRT